MKACRVLLMLAVAAVAVHPFAAEAGQAQQAYESGKALLAKGDLPGALDAYATAARTDRDNRQYMREYSILRRAIELRGRLDAEKDPKRWEYMAQALHAFYLGQGILPEALKLDREIHARLNTAASARMLAETQLAMNQNAQAAEMLATLDPQKVTATTEALRAVALAREGKTEEARQIAQSVVPPKEAGPRMVYAVAWMHAAVGDSSQALKLLARSFESLAPGQLDGYKGHAELCPEFARLPKAQLAKVLKTESKVSESKCSGGSKCAGCPMRGKCQKSQKQ